MKKILFTGLLVSSLFVTAACDSSDVAAGAIGVGIGIGIGGLDNDRRHDDRYDRGGRYDRGDRWGRGGYNDGRRGRNCNQYRCYSAESAVAGEMQEFAAESTTQSFAQKHNISNESAQKIQKAFKNVNQSGLASFKAIGLDKAAVDQIMSRELPEAGAIKSMSQSLNLTETHTRTMLQNLVEEFQAEVSDSNSNYWQSCQAKGQWKTPQNAFCSNASWNGCSPATGATLCY